MKRYVLLLALFCISVVLPAQKSLNENWSLMLEKAETYEPYKVIKRVDLNAIWKDVQDTISSLKKNIGAQQSEIASQKRSIENLKTEVTNITAQYNEAKSQTDNITFIGIEADKYAFMSVLLFLLILTVAGLLLLFLRFKASHYITSQKISEYEQLSRSFEEYKLSKIELERKLRRELQTQINIVEEMKRK